MGHRRARGQNTLAATEALTTEDTFPARLERLFNATSLDDLRSVFGTNWIDTRVVVRVNTDGETEYISAKSGNTGIYWTKDISKAKLFSNDTKLEDIGRNSEAATGELVSVHAILSQFNNDNSLVMFGEDTPFADVLTKVKEYVHLLSPLGEPQGWTWTPSKKGFFSSVNESLLHPMGHSNDQVTTSVSTEDAVASGQPELAVKTQTERIQNLEAAIREQMRLSKGAMSALSGVAKKVEAANQLSTPRKRLLRWKRLPTGWSAISIATLCASTLVSLVLVLTATVSWVRKLPRS